MIVQGTDTMGKTEVIRIDGNGTDPAAELEALRQRYNELRAAVAVHIASRHETTRNERLEAYAVLCEHVRQGSA